MGAEEGPVVGAADSGTGGWVGAPVGDDDVGVSGVEVGEAGEVDGASVMVDRIGALLRGIGAADGAIGATEGEAVEATAKSGHTSAPFGCTTRPRLNTADELLRRLAADNTATMSASGSRSVTKNEASLPASSDPSRPSSPQ